MKTAGELKDTFHVDRNFETLSPVPSRRFRRGAAGRFATAAVMLGTLLVVLAATLAQLKADAASPASAEATKYSDVDPSSHTPRPVSGTLDVSVERGATGAQEARAGGVTFFTDPAAFDNAVAGAGKVLKGIEDFEEAVAPPDSVLLLGCDPLDTACNDGVFSPGDILFNLAFQSNIASPGMVKSLGQGLALLTPPFVGALNNAVGSNFFSDSFDVLSLNPNHTAIALSVVDLAFAPGIPIEVRVFDKNGSLLGMIIVNNAAPAGTFVGFVVPTPGTIGRVNIRSHDGIGNEGGELLYDIEAYVGPVCGDGIIQPPEECDDGNSINGDGCDVNCLLEGCNSNADCGKCETCDLITNTCNKDVPNCCTSNAQCGKCETCDLITNTCNKDVPNCCTDNSQCPAMCVCDLATNTCTCEPVCGDGVVQPPEECETDFDCIDFLGADCVNCMCLDPDVIPAGPDCWKTQCGDSRFSFCENPVPADFFAPGSEPFDGVIQLGGGATGGNADTIIQRLQTIPVPQLGGPSETIQIEIVALSLSSCDPVRVTINDNETLWDVEVDLSPTPAPQGQMEVTKTNENGGTFHSDFNVQPRFTFTRVDPPFDVHVFDTGAEGIPPARLESRGLSYWVQDDEGEVPPIPPCEPTPNFVPGARKSNPHVCCTPTGHAGPGHLHVTGQICVPCPHGACCNPSKGFCELVEGPGPGNCNGVYMGDGTDCSDTDGDGIADVFETNDCCSPGRNSCRTGTDPNNPDSDGDGFSDGFEVKIWCDPCVFNVDTNGNGIPDKCEQLVKFSQPPKPVPCDCKGDINKDGQVTFFGDVFVVQNCADTGNCAGCVNSCDVDCNGTVDQADVDAVFCQTVAGGGHPPEECCSAAGEDYPSNIDWVDRSPNQVAADDFVSDGRPITAVRWWGSNIPKRGGGEVKPGVHVQPGVDLWKTVTGPDTFQNFTGDPIPPGFFDPGSDSFTGTVLFEGVPLGASVSLEGTDTIVERLDTAVLDFCEASEATITIEIVALSLRATAPITVTFNGGQSPEQWDLRVFLSDAPQALGQMTIRQRCPGGGTYAAILPVSSKLIFTRQGDNAVRVFDAGLQGLAPNVFKTDGTYVYQADAVFGVPQAPAGTQIDFDGDGVIDTVLAIGSSNFVPGIEEKDCNDCKVPSTGQNKAPPTREQAMWAAHGVATPQSPGGGGGCGDGIVDPGEECDPPGSPCPDGGTCQADCTCPPPGLFCCIPFEACFPEEDAALCALAGGFQVQDCQAKCPLTQRAAGETPATRDPLPLGADLGVRAPHAHTPIDDADGAPEVRFATVTWEQMAAFDAASAPPEQWAVPLPEGPQPIELEAVPGMGDRELTPGGTDPEQLVAPPLLTSFAGTIDDGTVIPPDTHGAVGPRHVVEILNSGFTIYDRGGGVVAPQITLQAFWAALGVAPGQPASIPFDPKIFYDQYEDRWIVVADGNPNARDGTTNSWLLVGISQTNSPTGAWNLFGILSSILDVNADHRNDWCDYPGVGLDPNNLIVSKNMFTVAANPAFVHSDVWVISKASMIAGAGALVQGVDYALFHNPCGTFGSTFQPCHTFGQSPANAVSYLVDGGWALPGQKWFRVKPITGVGAAAVLNCQGGNDWIEVADYNFGVLGAPQPSCAALINTNDTRLLNAVCWKGRIWTTHHVANAAGKTEVAWYEIDPTVKGPFTTAGVPVQQGRVSDPSLYYYFPSIAVNKDQCMALGFSGSDDNTFASAYYTVHDPAVNTPGVTQVVGLLKAGVAPYWKTFQSPSQRNRWGDYSATVLDPRDLHTFWTVQEYAEAPFVPGPGGTCAKDGARWGTWWGSFQCENSIDGWFISFHEPLQKEDPQNEPLALYYCDVKVVDIQPTKLPDCQNHQIYEYFVDLDSCCLVHANFDSRTDEIPAMKNAFYEVKHLQYHIDIQAVIGHAYTQNKETGECIEKVTGKGAFADFWGWHTTINEEGKKPALQSFVKMGPLGEWFYGPWVNVQPKCSFPNMAFELLTTQPPTPGGCCFTSTFPGGSSCACRVMTQEACALMLNSSFLGFGKPCPQGPQASHDSGVVTHFTSPPLACLGGCVPSPSSLRGNSCIAADPIDPWVTSEGAQMCHQFGIIPDSPTIPADFFEPGSDPFDDQVCLENDPLGPVTLGVPYPDGLDFGEADTLIRRSADPFDRCALPGQTPVIVDIEIVALSLNSIAPITVVVSGQDTLWDVHVGLSPSVTPVPGSITAVRKQCNGGTYTSDLHVQPEFTFTKVSGPGNPLGSVVVLDTGAEGIPFLHLIQPAGGDPDPSWSVDLQPDESWQSPVCTDFHPSMVDPNPTNICDCNGNGQRDKCDIEQAISQDLIDSDGNPNPDGIPDECQVQCAPPVVTGDISSRYIQIEPDATVTDPVAFHIECGIKDGDTVSNEGWVQLILTDYAEDPAGTVKV
ncbi:MAG: DUF4215 domain-containing protein, partial [Phycisphaerae bacterium]